MAVRPSWFPSRAQGAGLVGFRHAGCEGAMMPVGLAGVELRDEEARAVAGAMPRRLAQFAAGRSCARQALRRLGMDRAVIPVGERGAPLWPDEVTGSISHTAETAAALVAPRRRWRSIGFDIEEAAAVTADLFEQLVSEEEGRRPASPALAPSIFSAKEAVFKALDPLHPRWIDFADITVDIDEDEGSFRARASRGGLDLALLGEGEGWLDRRDGLVAAMFCLKP
jgi:4'-phosphopantetheinyl transferase EntD